MPPVLSDAWIERSQQASSSLPERPGASAVIQYELSGGPEGAATLHLVLDDGRIVDGGIGPADEPDFSMQMAWKDFLASLTGDFDPTVGFMRGEVKVVGNVGRLLSVLPVTTSDEWREAMADLAAATDDIADG